MEQVLLSQSGKNIIVKSHAYENEEELQEIVKANPLLINLSSIFGSPIMIIGRESENIDVLAITATAVPVIIECKRKDNHDMRSIIAQVFEYASKLNQKSYNEFDEIVTRYFSSIRCEEEQYRNLSLKDAFKKFRASITDTNESYDENKFVNDLSEYLRNGEFFLIIVVDMISDVAFRTVQFLNSKMRKLRIEIIEVSKYSNEDRNIFVPNHINRESRRITDPQPGKITLEEMIENCGAKEAEYIREFKNIWEGTDFTIIMGTKGFSAKYNDISILWVQPDYIELPRVNQHKDKLLEIIKKHPHKGNRIYFNDHKFTSDKLKTFIKEIKDFCVNVKWNTDK